MRSLTDVDLHAHGDPHAVWTALRRDEPVSRQSIGEHPYWAVTTYDLGFEALIDWQRFTSHCGTFLRPDPFAPYPGAGSMMALSDPPQHDLLRKAMIGLFTARAVAGMTERARSIIRPALAAAVEAGRMDVVTDFAARIPLLVFAELLGIGEDEIDLIAESSTAAAENSDDLFGVEAQHAHMQILMHYSELIGRRRAEPVSDVASALVTAQADGLPISDDEIVLACDNVVVAANETTRQAIGAGVLALVEHPEQWAALRAGAVPMKSAVDEFLRWSSPVTHLLRAAKVDCELGGVPIRAGELVAAWLPSMNRDETVFDDPFRFDLGRRPKRHATFGAGVHLCIGASLSRLTIGVLLEELAALPVDLALDGTPRRIASYILGGLTSLPVAFSPSQESRSWM